MTEKEDFIEGLARGNAKWEAEHKGEAGEKHHPLVCECGRVDCPDQQAPRVRT